jgi:alkylhydroperoxidase family enzyme
MSEFQAGQEALEKVAPQVAAAIESLEAASWQALARPGRADLLDLAARVVAAQHGLEPLERPSGIGKSPWASADAAAWRNLEALSDADRAALRFAEQVSFDVASVQDDERTALFEALGASAVPFVQAVYVADFLPRVRFALDSVFGESDWSARAAADPSSSPADLQAGFDELIRRVPQLQALDPVSTELIRVLGAQRHRCRLCQSLRSRSALVAGADDEVFAAVDRYARGDFADPGRLTGPQKAALAFVDAMIGVPGRVGPEQVQALRSSFAPEACVEIVLDVMRNATNKVAVALAADAPHVESGYEIYDVGPDGELLFGLQAP